MIIFPYLRRRYGQLGFLLLFNDLREVVVFQHTASPTPDKPTAMS